MLTADILRQIFKCKDDAELGKVFDRSGSVVSVWRIKGLPASIERRANELMRERGLIAEQEMPYQPEIKKVVDPLKQAAYDCIDRMDDEEVLEFVTTTLKKAISDKQKQ